jgi:hypothetical protein
MAVDQTKPCPQKVREMGGQMRSPGQRSEPPRLTSLPVRGPITPPTPRELTERSMPATRNIPASNRGRSNIYIGLVLLLQCVESMNDLRVTCRPYNGDNAANYFVHGHHALVDVIGVIPRVLACAAMISHNP